MGRYGARYSAVRSLICSNGVTRRNVGRATPRVVPGRRGGDVPPSWGPPRTCPDTCVRLWSGWGEGLSSHRNNFQGPHNGTSPSLDSGLARGLSSKLMRSCARSCAELEREPTRRRRGGARRGGTTTRTQQLLRFSSLIFPASIPLPRVSRTLFFFPLPGFTGTATRPFSPPRPFAVSEGSYATRDSPPLKLRVWLNCGAWAP